MIIRRKPPRTLAVNEPIRHTSSHKRPISRRDFIGAGFLSGPAVLAVPSIVSLLANPRNARAELQDSVLRNMKGPCGIMAGAGKIPFIAFDLAGGANLVGSEILVGGQTGQLQFLSTAGYARLGLPGDMVPNAPNAASATNNFIDTTFGAAWHADGALLRGMREKALAAAPNTNAAVIAARSENDTANNPHNPMYAIATAGARGSLLSLIGSRNTDSGGNSMAPASMINPELRPTKVDRASDVTGLVDTGKLVGLLSEDDSQAVVESIARISHHKVDRAITDPALQKLIKCGYVKAADLVDQFGNPATLNPDLDTDIVGPTGIFTQAEYDNDDEFRKTAAVMKMVMFGFAGAGTITMGGYDYHGQGRATGELRNLRAGRCIGACLEYARRRNKPLMIYVFSDGSLSADGQVDNSVDGRGKFMWASDNQSTAASIMLVYNPNGRPAAIRNQIGWFRPDGSVETASSPAANAVNLLVQTVALNYMALHREQGQFAAKFPNHGLGGTQQQDSLIAFAPIV